MSQNQLKANRAQTLRRTQQVPTSPNSLTYNPEALRSFANRRIEADARVADSLAKKSAQHRKPESRAEASKSDSPLRHVPPRIAALKRHMEIVCAREILALIVWLLDQHAEIHQREDDITEMH